jgi:hypothetical protein
MACLQTSQGVSNLVQDAIANRCFVVGQHKVNRELDPPFAVPAQPHRPLCAIKFKRPVVQSMVAQQAESQLPSFRGSENLLAIHDKVQD